MDPNATLRIIDQARRPSDRACRKACLDLLAWLGRGGFEPDWQARPLGTKRFQAWKGRSSVMEWICARCGKPSEGPPTKCCRAGVYDPTQPEEPGTLKVPWLWIPRGAKPGDMSPDSAGCS